MIEVMMMPEDSMIRIAGVEKPVALVKNRFMKLNLFAYRICAVLSESEYDQDWEY